MTTMKDFIELKLNQIYLEFQSEARKVGKFCSCKGLTYEGGNTPDYSDALVQKHYMLRFFPAYLAEYYLMYGQMLNQSHLGENLKVISIGCGCGVDLWGLFFAAKEFDIDPDRLYYTGVDIVDWHCKDNLGLKNVRFIKQDISEWHELDRDDYNIIVFPKCIGEFPSKVFESICEMFENSSFSSDRICCLCSLMDKGKEVDAMRFTRIANIFLKSHGYSCLDEMKIYWKSKKNEGLRAICPQFVYPDDILEHVKKLGDLCPTYQKNGKSCEKDCSSLNRWPILKTSFINYKYLRFEHQAT